MSVFRDLYNYIFDGDMDNKISGNYRYKLEAFLNEPTEPDIAAKQLFDHIGESYSKGNTDLPKGLFNMLKKMNLYEVGLESVLPGMREHFIHSAGVYVLGLAIFNKCAPIREAICTFNHVPHPEWKTEVCWESFIFRWSLAACLHDIAYPLDYSLRAFNQFTNIINSNNTDITQSVGSFINVKPEIYQDINRLPLLPQQNDFDGVSTELRKETALELIASNLTLNSLLNYDGLLNEFEEYIKQELEKGSIDHGVAIHTIWHQINQCQCH